MLKDFQNLAVTTDSPEAIVAINHFIDQALFYGKNARAAILQAIAADPTCAIAHAYAASHFLSQEHSNAWKQAVPHLIAIRQFISKATLREQGYAEGILAWAQGDIDRAIACHERLAEEYPEDLISVQQAQYHYFYQGEAKQLLNVAVKVLPSHASNHYLYGMVAFGLEQCGDLVGAEVLGRWAVSLNRNDPWAQHAIAHVLESQGRFVEGIEWMEQHSDTWEQCNTMLYTHNWWHLALYYLSLGDTQTVLNLYDHRVWGRADKRSPKDQVGAIATLLRLELRGVDVGDRWQSLVPYLESRLHEHALAFQDLHYLYALARADRWNWVSEMLQSWQTHLTVLKPSLRKIWTEITFPTARGLIAHAQGNWSAAVSLLKPVLPQLHQVGGSITQRKLFGQVYEQARQQSELLTRSSQFRISQPYKRYPEFKTAS
ncbi:MAG: tetratricopeptide repeat protein [Leptolyngbyaceae cyanobacterium bins.59]|nr:tetratricopeptide repeat protein [Leptolyngbyaceae cyanobacterium bins.59]